MNFSGGRSVLLCFFLTIVKDTCGQMQPSNAVVEIGGQAIFNCSGISFLPNWVMSRDGNTTDQLPIAGSCNVNVNLQNHYKTEQIGGPTACNLIVFNVTMEQAGVYWCSDGVPSYALFTVIDHSPTITYNETQDVVVENESVIVTCTTQHNGSVSPAPTLRPYFYWTNSSGQNVLSSYDNTTENTAVSQITVAARRPNIAPYTCHVYLQLDPSTSPGYANNIPVVSNSNSSTTIEVLYSPGNIEITSSAKYDCIFQEETLTCTADANPPAQYEWLDLINNTVTDGPDKTIKPGGQCQCTASNCIRNQTYSETMPFNASRCSSSSLAWIAIPIYFGLCLLLGLLFLPCYDKSKRKDIYNKKYPFLVKMLPCLNKKDSDNAQDSNVGWVILYIVMITFVGLFAIPIFFFTVQCSKEESKVNNEELRTADQIEAKNDSH